jgi:hypothetical protein
MCLFWRMVRSNAELSQAMFVAACGAGAQPPSDRRRGTSYIRISQHALLANSQDSRLPEDLNPKRNCDSISIVSMTKLALVAAEYSYDRWVVIHLDLLAVVDRTSARGVGNRRELDEQLLHRCRNE